MNTNNNKPILRFRGLSKHFPGVVALNDVSFDIEAGSIHGICGENGAGKSTLIKILAGIYPHGSYEGTIERNGFEMSFADVSDSIEAGIAVVYQELELINELTVGENIYLGREQMRGPVIDWHKLFYDTNELCKEYNLNIDPNDRVADLAIGRQQMVEIAKALAKKATILIFDEPTSVLSDNEIERLHSILRILKENGVTCIYITHRLDEFFSISDRITILRDGQFIATHNTKETDIGQLISAMVGRSMTKRFPERRRNMGEPLLRVENLTVGDRFDETVKYVKHADFTLHRGEVLGIAGLMGSGRTELAYALIGELGHVVNGSATLDGKPLVTESARSAIEQGILLVPENRKEQGLILMQSIVHNISLPNLDALSSFMYINRTKELSEAQSYGKKLSIKAPNLLVAVNNLSGGNQQKVVIAKTLMAEPKVLILDDPTRGIDVGAKFEIYKLIDQLASNGVAIIMISSELEEVIGMSDRIVVIHERSTVAVLEKNQFEQGTIMSYATGVYGEMKQ